MSTKLLSITNINHLSLEQLINELQSLKDFDYAFLKMGYTERIMRFSHDPDDPNINLSKFKNFVNDKGNHIKSINSLVTYFDEYLDNDNIEVLAIGRSFSAEQKWWSDSDLYCNNNELVFLNNTRISPEGCVVIKGRLNKLSCSDIDNVINQLMKLHFCARFGKIFCDMEIYKFQDKTIVKLEYDTESG